MLKALNISNNPILILPDEIFDLKELVDLRVSKARLSSISKSINNLTNLKTLFMDGNNIKELPDTIC
jgi:leucine-rich repeat protein SHOC2